MRSIAVILIILGIAMLIFHGVTYTKEKNVVDAGPIQINKKENKTIAWPVYGGGIVIVAGVIILLAYKKSG